MVTQAVAETTYSTAFPEWRDLLAMCDEYASLTGWRFVKQDFMNMGMAAHDDMDKIRAARERAMPVALEYAHRIAAIIEATKAGAEPTRLLTEFDACQRLVASEAVYNSVCATLTAVGLGDFGGGIVASSRKSPPLPPPPPPPPANGSADGAADEDDPEECAYQDMSQPIEVIARRLRAYQRKVLSSTAFADERQQRALHASFIVEFGLEHGLPERRDPTSEATLKEFLERLREWEGGKQSEVVRSLVLESIPAGPAQRGLRSAVLDFFEHHPTEALVGGAVIGAAIGLIAASAGVAVASALSARRR